MNKICSLNQKKAYSLSINAWNAKYFQWLRVLHRRTFSTATCRAMTRDVITSWRRCSMAAMVTICCKEASKFLARRMEIGLKNQPVKVSQYSYCLIFIQFIKKLCSVLRCVLPIFAWVFTGISEKKNVA